MRSLQIGSNEALTTITGFTNVSGISILQITSNSNLGSIAGLSSLRQVWQRMDIHSNGGEFGQQPAFDYSGLSGLECIEGLNCPNCPSWLTNLPTCNTFCNSSPNAGNALCQHCASRTPPYQGDYCG